MGDLTAGTSTADLSRRVDLLTARNAKLADLLRESRDQLLTLREEVDNLSAPPNTYGTLLRLVTEERPERAEPAAAAALRASQAGGRPQQVRVRPPLAVTTADVLTAGRVMRLTISPLLDHAALTPGTRVRLNESLTVVAAAPVDRTGVVRTIVDLLAGGRAIVADSTNARQVVLLAAELQAGVPAAPGTGETTRRLRVGDTVLVDDKAGIAVEFLPRDDSAELVLEEVPTVSYDDIGGLSSQIEQIRESVETPFLHRDLYAQYHLRPPKGVLLYGPPGCGKTLIAKAVAHSLVTQIAQASGHTLDDVARRSYFLSIKGPELLNKYVGETERQIREIFRRARDKASYGMPVIVFFDEMDSVFRTRGSGVSSDVETTVVPQLLAELDGVESLENVILIGATNREDMIDPAILRPGRLDVKIKIERPDREAAREIFARYLSGDVPLRGHSAEQMIDRLVDRMYARDESTRFLEVTYASGRTEELHFADFISGAMISNVVDRAKKSAIRDVIDGAEPGLRLEALLEAVEAEFRENEDLPDTTNPDEWARVSGKKGERVVYLRTLTGTTDRPADTAVSAAPAGELSRQWWSPGMLSEAPAGLRKEKNS